MEPHILNLDFPDAIETARLIIRSPQAGDGPEFNAAILESMEGLQKWLGLYKESPPTVEETEALMRQKHAEFLLRQDMMLLCFLKGSNTFVVSSGLHPNWKVPSFEIGYWCRQSYQGQGYVTEAVNGIADFAFTQLNAKRVFIRCDSDNSASANVARRTGFEFEGTLRHDSRNHSGELRNTFMFSQIRPDETG
ncbi:MAG: GNAT family N-acetyltransferase [Caldilineaceae bacterium]|nr:GNAT family N-acetyltransferase [Caldilineaceae bacterium]